MMRHGLLVFPDSDYGRSTCVRRVAGLSLLDRGIRTLARQGVTALTVIVPAGARLPLPGHTRRLPLSLRMVTWDQAHKIRFPDDEPVLVLLGDHVHHHSSLAAFVAAAAGVSGMLVQTAAADKGPADAWHVVEDAGTIRFTEPRSAAAPLSAGSFICPGALLRDTSMGTAGRDFTGFLASRAYGQPIRLIELPPLWRVVHDRRSAAAARNMLFSQVTKPTSGFISRHLNARISIPISKILVGTRMSPHMVTVTFVLSTGLVSAYLISRPDPYWRVALAGLLWQFAAILDRCDGEIARVKLCESAFGAWFDTLTDNLAYICTYVALVAGLSYLHPGKAIYPVTGTAAVVALLFTLGILYTYARRTGSGSLQHYLRDLNKHVPETRKGWVQRFMQRVGFVAKRDCFSFIICILLVSSQVELTFWFIVILLFVAAVTVLLSQRTMLQAAALNATAAAIAPVSAPRSDAEGS